MHARVLLCDESYARVDALQFYKYACMHGWICEKNACYAWMDEWRNDR
jgi:hypothetical protein